jgi:hypothetical protein
LQLANDTILLDTDRYYLVNLDVLLGIFDAIAASYQH